MQVVIYCIFFSFMMSKFTVIFSKIMFLLKKKQIWKYIQWRSVKCLRVLLKDKNSWNILIDIIKRKIVLVDVSLFEVCDILCEASQLEAYIKFEIETIVVIFKILFKIWSFIMLESVAFMSLPQQGDLNFVLLNEEMSIGWGRMENRQHQTHPSTQ